MKELKHKGILFNVGGQILVIPPITREEHEKWRVKSNNFSENIFDPAALPALIDAIHSAIARNYPDMTREQVAEGVDFINLQKLFEALLDVKGTRQKQITAKMRRLNS